jgi:acyl-CoA synthetase (AMP-forming)/AMP-acid ligase II
VSDAMKSGGYKIYPQEIERALAAAFPGHEPVIVGLPSDYWGEVIAAVAENPGPDWESRARAACADLASFKHPRLFFAVDAFPRNGQGKLVRRHLVTALLERWRLVDGPRPAVEPIQGEPR